MRHFFKAHLKSKLIMLKASFWFIKSTINASHVRRFGTVKRPKQNPCRHGDSGWTLSTYSCSCNLTIFSSVFPKHERRLLGLYAQASEWSPFPFYKGKMLAHFHDDENLPFVSDCWKIVCCGSKIDSATFKNWKKKHRLAQQRCWRSFEVHLLYHTENNWTTHRWLLMYRLL